MTTVTIKDVVCEARVSVVSISRALNGNGGVTAETEQRIRKVAARLRHIPHSAARSLITRRTNTIGALLRDLYGKFFSEMIRDIDLAARARGLHLLVSSSHNGVEDAATAMRTMQGWGDGMLILSPHVDAAFLHANLPQALPTVLLNSAVKDPAHPVLNIDNVGGAYAMVRHLVGIGHADVTFIGGPASAIRALAQGQRADDGRLGDHGAGAVPDAAAPLPARAITGRREGLKRYAHIGRVCRFAIAWRGSRRGGWCWARWLEVMLPPCPKLSGSGIDERKDTW